MKTSALCLWRSLQNSSHSQQSNEIISMHTHVRYYTRIYRTPFRISQLAEAFHKCCIRIAIEILIDEIFSLLANINMDVACQTNFNVL